MFSYKNFKKILVEHKAALRFGFYACVIFALGFGTGRGARQLEAQPAMQTNYPTKTEKKPEEKPAATPAAKANQGTAKTESTKTDTGKKPLDLKNCPIKGNISSKDKVYHLKGGSFYDRTTPEQCFNTEAEAQAAGFRKSSR